MLDTLFGLIPAASRGQQWLAHELQLVNWGGYDGAHRVRFSPGATLLCGGSGSGKSTLMDAYIALMMPHTTPFNGASNGGVSGRPRGEDQRNILSYGRGKIDESRSETGTQVRVLRGDGSDTWTAISMTWVDHDGSKFTAVRAWYIPAGARAVEDTVRVRATSEGDFDLSSLAQAATQRLSDSSVQASGLDTVATDREFTARIHSVLGIGAAGAGAKAMSLLARIQAGQQITTVDELYKRMVLEEPETLATADAIVSHFDELEGTRARMVAAQRQVAALRPIRGMRTRIESSIDRLRLIEDIGQLSSTDSLVSLWRADRRLALLRSSESELRTLKAAADRTVREQLALAEAAEAERDGIVEVLRSADGGRLEAAERELRDAERRLAQVQAGRSRLDALVLTLELTVSSAREFEALTSLARAELSNADAKTSSRDDYAEARGARRQLETSLNALEDELTETVDRNDNIPPVLHESRALLAKAAGIPISELSFVGELIEVRTEFEPWRSAFGQALGSFATTLLVSEERLPAFRAAINDVHTPVRLRFEGARADVARVTSNDANSLPGRLDYRETEFTGWLQERLTTQFNFICVNTAGELGKHPRAVTISGQVSQGSRGAHGGHLRAATFGFSSEQRLEALATDIAAARAALEEATLTESFAAQSLDEIDVRHAAYAKLQDLSWSEVDTAKAEAECERWTAVMAEVQSGSTDVSGLQQQLAAVKKKAARLQQSIGRAQAEQERIAERWAAVTDQVDAAQQAIDDAEDAGRALSTSQIEYLDERFLPGAPADGDAGSGSSADRLSRFDATLESVAKQLTDDQRSAQETLEDQRDALRRTLERFLENWPNPNLRADPDTSFLDFERILAEIETSGLHELEAEWRDSLLNLSGNDLTSLDSALGRALREIRDRIDPINQIMQDLPFYDDAHRLQITPRENQSDARRHFRRELRDLRVFIAEAETDAEREQAYVRMSRLITKIRRSSPVFAELIDVRNHVRISAEKIEHATGQHAALYDHIGEKSGGESQELIAFIVGAALRYQLGDAGAERPRYAPVFLDEALIKADAHFTKRAIGAWRGLGFQLVIGAPNDKYSAIEPHVDVEYDILKDTKGRSWAKPKVALPQ